MIDQERLLKIEETDGTHRYVLDGFPIPSVSKVIDGAGYKSAMVADVAAYQRKGLIGKALHSAAQFLEEGALDRQSVDPSVIPYLECFERFLAERKPVLTSCEEMGFREDFYYAGTWDRKYMIDGELWRLDLKCSYAKAPWWGIQLALYDLADCKTRRAALWLRPKARRTYELVKFPDQDYADAIAATVCYQYRVRNGLIEGIARPIKEAA